MEEIRTGAATVTVTEEDGVTTVAVVPDDGTRQSVTRDRDDVVVRVWKGRRVPRIGDEVQVDGTSFEVTRVEMDPDGTVWVCGDTGRKVRWE